MFAYFVLMSWCANLYDTLIRRIGCALGFVLLAVRLVFLQQRTAYRSFEVADMISGAADIVFGWLVVPALIPNDLCIAEKHWRAHS